MSWRLPLAVLAVGGVLLGAKAAPSGRDKPVDSKLLAEQALAACHAYETVWEKFTPFDLKKGDGEDVYRWSRRWLEAERDQAKAPAERRAALQKHVERMKKLENEVQQYQRGTIPILQLGTTRFYRAEAER